MGLLWFFAVLCSPSDIYRLLYTTVTMQIIFINVVFLHFDKKNLTGSEYFAILFIVLIKSYYVVFINYAFPALSILCRNRILEVEELLCTNNSHLSDKHIPLCACLRFFYLSNFLSTKLLVCRKKYRISLPG